jgi:hypothetical protein
MKSLFGGALPSSSSLLSATPRSGDASVVRARGFVPVTRPAGSEIILLRCQVVRALWCWGLCVQEYSLKVEVPAKGDTSKMLTLGKAVIDMVRYINFANTAEEATVPIKFKVASGGTGFLKVPHCCPCILCIRAPLTRPFIRHSCGVMC